MRTYDNNIDLYVNETINILKTIVVKSKIIYITILKSSFVHTFDVEAIFSST
jgi:hypothetical protein